MRFVIDAQLPRRILRRFGNAGHDAVHTLDLPDGNRTPDADVAALADRERRAVVTKDTDFVDSHLLLGRPARLLLISTGNLDNVALYALLMPRPSLIVGESEKARFLELIRDGLVIRD